MNQTQSINELAEALALAQGKIVGAAKDSSNPFFGSKYADLASVWEACREALSSEGLSVLQPPSVVIHGEPEVYTYTKKGEERVGIKCATEVRVTTRLLHKSGQWIEDSCASVLAFADPQSVGSAITYLRRYALAAMVGVAPEDDDAEATPGNAAKKSAPGPMPRRSPEMEAIDQHWRRVEPSIKRLIALGIADPAVLDRGNGGIAMDAFRGSLMQGVAFDRKNPEHWKAFADATEEAVKRNTPPDA